MELIQITHELHDASRRLERGSKELFALAKEYAEAERAYRQALAKEILMLKDAGMSVTLIPDLSRGNVAEQKFARDLAEAKYQAGRDAVRAIETQVSALQSILRVQGEV